MNKWKHRSAIKTALLDLGVPMELISGRWLNKAAGLPENAKWKEGNFR